MYVYIDHRFKPGNIYFLGYILDEYIKNNADRERIKFAANSFFFVCLPCTIVNEDFK